MKNSRLARECNTISKMIVLYCSKHHESIDALLCDDCQTLETYAHQRIAHCPFGTLKPTCARCTVHCYKPEQRAAIRQVMRFSGPRMLIHHPLLTLLHLLDGLRFRQK